MADKIGIYLSGLLILGCYSYLFKENRLYTYIEHVYVGFAAAQAIVLGWKNIVDGAFRPLQKGQWSIVVPLALGCLLYARFSKSLSYLARLPMALMMGVAAGASITGVVETQFIKQVRATMLPLTSINNAVIVLGTASTVAFFLFIPLGGQSRIGTPASGGSGGSGGTGGGSRTSGARAFAPLAVMSAIGRATIMVAFGSSYGFTVMSRLSYLVARLQFLFGKWIPLIPQ